MRTIDTLVVHHSASRNTVRPATIKRWHIDKGWSDVGYHWLIDASGTLYAGRPFWKQGAHAKGRNRNSLGVCVIGDQTRPASLEHRWTVAQHATLSRLISAVRLIFGEVEVVGHRDAGSTATECPGVDVQTHPDVRLALADTPTTKGIA